MIDKAKALHKRVDELGSDINSFELLLQQAGGSMIDQDDAGVAWVGVFKARGMFYAMIRRWESIPNPESKG